MTGIVRKSLLDPDEREDFPFGSSSEVHTGEVEVVPGNLRGVAVHIVARIAALAQATRS